MALKLFAQAAFQNFAASSGNRYTADANKVVTVTTPDDTLDLLRAGCTLTPPFAVNVPFNQARTATGAALDATGGAGLFKIAQTLGTSTLLSSESAVSNTKTDIVSFEHTLPGSYQPGADITVSVQASIAGAGTLSTKTLQLKAYKVTAAGVHGADIGSAAQVMVAAGSVLAFTITGATLNPGDKVVFSLTAILTETAASGMVASIGSITLS